MMKPIVVVLLAMGLAGAASAETEKSAKPQNQEAAAKPAKKTASAKAETKQTPFGPAKVTAAEPFPETELSSDPFVSAEEKGELVVFRRKTPFGSQVWKKKKSELTADEQAILARRPRQEEKPKAAPAKPAAKTKASKPKASDQ